MRAADKEGNQEEVEKCKQAMIKLLGQSLKEECLGKDCEEIIDTEALEPGEAHPEDRDDLEDVLAEFGYNESVEDKPEEAEEELPAVEGKQIIWEFLPGQYDQRADSAEQCIGLLRAGLKNVKTNSEAPVVRCAKIVVLAGNPSDDDIKKIQNYLVNPVDSRLTDAEKPETLKMKMDFITTMVGIFSCIMAILFYINGILPMMIFDVFIALFFFVVVHNLLKKENYSLAMIMTISIVVVNSFTTTLSVGFNAGFSAYLLGCVAACFYLTFVIESFQKRELIPVLMSLFFTACYIFNYIIMKFVDPLYPLKNDFWYDIFNLLNFGLSFIIIIAFNILFLWEIKARNTLLSNKNEQLDEMAHKDPLTRLYNRRSMSEYLTRALENLKNNGKRFCLILCDIDDFKHVNDSYGHDAGDAVLVDVSNIISSSTSDNDIVCRWGGEEILILINSPIETATITAERIRKRLEDNVTHFADLNIKVTMTFGISESIPGYRIEQLIQQADEKLYSGKKNGKNQVVV